MKKPTKTLKDASEAELAAALEQKRKEREAGERPRPLKQFSVQKLVDCCDAYIESLVKDGFTDDDSKQYIYEAAMKTIYGPDIFKWINKRLS